jgi:ABC-type Fe3+/spermidine/putrescine transport system ATPase subunit
VIVNATEDPTASLDISEIGFSYRNTGFTLSVNLSVPTPIRLAVLGPNASGKTTLLRLLGGHLRPNLGGKIVWAGVDLTNLPPKMRPTSTVFQDFALFPHFTVRENIEFPLRHRNKLTKLEARREAAKWADELGLKDDCEKRPSVLSPGVQQRVALARSLAIRPQLLLLDEPSASLDVSEKHRLILILNQLFERRSVGAMILVTHDLDLAFSVADKIAVLDKGKLKAYNDSVTMLRRPSSAWLARYLKSHNVICGTLDGNSFVFKGGIIQLTASHRGETSSMAGKVAFLVPTSAVSIVDPSDARVDVLRARVDGHIFQGSYCEISLSIGAASIRSFARDIEALPDVGTDVFLAFDLTRAELLPNTECGDDH